MGDELTLEIGEKLDPETISRARIEVRSFILVVCVEEEEL